MSVHQPSEAALRAAEKIVAHIGNGVMAGAGPVEKCRELFRRPGAVLFFAEIIDAELLDERRAMADILRPFNDAILEAQKPCNGSPG